MLYNVSYTNPEIEQAINELVGRPFGIRDRLKMGGIGSPKLNIVSCSLQIHNLLVLDNNRNVCNIELRPKGILIGFRSLLESYVLPIPYHKLSVYKGDAHTYTFYKDNYHIGVEAPGNNSRIHRFIQGILQQKNTGLPTRIEDL